MTTSSEGISELLTAPVEATLVAVDYSPLVDGVGTDFEYAITIGMQGSPRYEVLVMRRSDGLELGAFFGCRYEPKADVESAMGSVLSELCTGLVGLAA